MRSLHLQRWPASILSTLLFVVALAAMAASTALAQSAPASPSPEGQFVDGIAAVVNKQVITLSQVEAEAKLAANHLRQQGIAVPDASVLRRQVLQNMISDELIRQEAERLNITVTDEQLARAVQSIAERNRITTDTLRKEIEKGGLDWNAYLTNLRKEIRTDQLRQRAVDSTIIISDAEVDAFLKNQARNAGGAGMPRQPQQAAGQAAGPQVLGLAQILVKVPENASSTEVQTLRAKAETLLSQIRGGADFASTAAASSDAPDALQGGELGVRPVEGWPDLFLQATQGLQAGQVSGVVQSGNGFHILKVLTRGPESSQAAQPQPQPQAAPNFGGQQALQIPEGPMLVTQTRASHILLKETKAMTEERAVDRLNQLRQRVLMGESFADLARRYSEDASAPQGGDLGWVSPGETVPAFERAMDALQPGEVSEIVHSPFGWHLIKVEERRTKDMEQEYRRMQARRILFERRIEPAFEDWLSQLHGQAYIDNRLNPQANRRSR